MRIIIILLIACLILLIFYFREGIKRFWSDNFLPDQNPQLVTYLQGDWAVANDATTVFKIKRDSIIETCNDTVRSVNRLHYVFSGAASKYFTSDSSFDFSSPGKRGLSTYDFKLREVTYNVKDTVWDTLKYVSRSKLDMISRGRIISLNRVK